MTIKHRLDTLVWLHIKGVLGYLFFQTFSWALIVMAVWVAFSPLMPAEPGPLPGDPIPLTIDSFISIGRGINIEWMNTQKTEWVRTFLSANTNNPNLKNTNPPGREYLLSYDKNNPRPKKPLYDRRGLISIFVTTSIIVAVSYLIAG